MLFWGEGRKYMLALDLISGKSPLGLTLPADSAPPGWGPRPCKPPAGPSSSPLDRLQRGRGALCAASSPHGLSASLGRRPASESRGQRGTPAAWSLPARRPARDGRAPPLPRHLRPWSRTERRLSGQRSGGAGTRVVRRRTRPPSGVVPPGRRRKRSGSRGSPRRSGDPSGWAPSSPGRAAPVGPASRSPSPGSRARAGGARSFPGPAVEISAALRPGGISAGPAPEAPQPCLLPRGGSPRAGAAASSWSPPRPAPAGQAFSCRSPRGCGRFGGPRCLSVAPTQRAGAKGLGALEVPLPKPFPGSSRQTKKRGRDGAAGDLF